LAKSWGMRVEERKISVKELIEALEKGSVQEAFGAGTAATIAHIELIGFEGKNYTLPPVEGRQFANRVFNELENIKNGIAPDPFDWIHRI